MQAKSSRATMVRLRFESSFIVRRHNVNVHRAAAKIMVSKSRAARGSVCNVLLSRSVRGVRKRVDQIRKGIFNIDILLTERLIVPHYDFRHSSS